MTFLKAGLSNSAVDRTFAVRPAVSTGHCGALRDSRNRSFVRGDSASAAS
jgi:hypothetical protein